MFVGGGLVLFLGLSGGLGPGGNPDVVVNVDGRTIGDGSLGPMTRRLSSLFQELTASQGEVMVS